MSRRYRRNPGGATIALYAVGGVAALMLLPRVLAPHGIVPTGANVNSPYPPTAAPAGYTWVQGRGFVPTSQAHSSGISPILGAGVASIPIIGSLIGGISKLFGGSDATGSSGGIGTSDQTRPIDETTPGAGGISDWLRDREQEFSNWLNNPSAPVEFAMPDTIPEGMTVVGFDAFGEPVLTPDIPLAGFSIPGLEWSGWTGEGFGLAARARNQ